MGIIALSFPCEFYRSGGQLGGKHGLFCRAHYPKCLNLSCTDGCRVVEGTGLEMRTPRYPAVPARHLKCAFLAGFLPKHSPLMFCCVPIPVPISSAALP